MAVAINSFGMTRRVGYSLTQGYTVSSGSDRFLMVTTTPASGSVTGTTYAGVALTTGDTHVDITARSLVAPATGTNNLVISFSTYSEVWIAWSDWTGVDQTTPLGTSGGVTDTDGSAVATGSSLTCPTDGVIYMFARGPYVGGGAFTSGTGSVVIEGGRHGGGGEFMAHGYRTTTGSVNINLPSSTGPNVRTLSYPFNAAGGGGGGGFIPRPPQRLLTALMRASVY